jgi:hypothetical protein
MHATSSFALRSSSILCSAHVLAEVLVTHRAHRLLALTLHHATQCILVDQVQHTELVVRPSRMSALGSGNARVLNASCFASTLGEWNTTFLGLTLTVDNVSNIELRGGTVDADIDVLITRIVQLTLDSVKPVRKMPACIRVCVCGGGGGSSRGYSD